MRKRTNTTTFDKELCNFTADYNDYISEYNDANNCSLEVDIRNAWEMLQSKNIKVRPSTFFRNIKSTLKATQSSYEGIDIVNYVLCILDDTRQRSLIQNYFDDVKRIYNSLPKDELEFCEKNRDTILKSNLKMVISTAKAYQNRGLDLEDLISAGNVGLCVAWEKYKPEHQVLRKKIMNELEYCPEQVTKDYIDSLLSPLVKYGDIKMKYNQYFSQKKLFKRSEVITWINKNIRKAKFSSVAALWIRAYILQELNSNSRLVKKPKSEIDKDLITHGSYLKENVISIDPLCDVDDNGNVLTKIELFEQHDIESDIDTLQEMTHFKEKLNILLDGVSNRDRRIIFKAFGIGLPRSMEPREIAENEDLSIARVSQVIQNSITKMRNNAIKNKMDINILLKHLN